MANGKRVLITGVAGQIGGVVREALIGEHDVSGIDIRKADGFESTVADMTNLEAIQPAFEGIDTVVDLANSPQGDLPWHAAYRNNIPAIYNALEAAKRAGVKRVIFASSNRASENYELDQPYANICAGDYTGLEPGKFPMITPDMPVRPSGPYGIAKAMGEAAGRYFSDRHGLSVICLRFGTVRPDSKPANVRHFATIFSHRDLAHLVERCVVAPDSLRFATFFGVSNNTWRFWDISNAQELVGFDPQDNMETYRQG